MVSILPPEAKIELIRSAEKATGNGGSLPAGKNKTKRVNVKNQLAGDNFSADTGKEQDMSRSKKPTKWMKLDNAALIYPATMNRNWTALFRLSATLAEPIDEDILEVAQKRTLRRLPWFAYRLKRGFSGSIWSTATICQKLKRTSPILRAHATGRKRRFLHARALLPQPHRGGVFPRPDRRHGGLVFLQTLVAEYLRLKYGADIPRGDRILDCSADPNPEEAEDSLPSIRERSRSPARRSRPTTSAVRTSAADSCTSSPDR
jgi:hypothetical protein